MGRLRRTADVLGLTRPADSPRKRWWRTLAEAVLVGACTLFVLWLFNVLFGWTI